MVTSITGNALSGIRISSMVPGNVTAEGKTHELTNVDLVMKLHYLRGLYFFKSDAVEGFIMQDYKNAMSPWLDLYYHTSGRIRRDETGRPFIKCNDGGVRIIEAHCDKTMEEWLALNDNSLHSQLVYDQVPGPELSFSPPVFMQFTWFKCGGISVGLTWTHVLGDTFSAATYINIWGQIMSGHMPKGSLNMPIPRNSHFPPSTAKKLLSVKRVEPVGDHWLAANNRKMETCSLRVSAKQLNHLMSNICGVNQTNKTSSFEVLSAVIWKSLAQIRGGSGPNIVTICQNKSDQRDNISLTNGQVLGIVEADFSIAKAELLELAQLIAEKMINENSIIEEVMERDNGKTDFIAYGANLTFVNLEEAHIYGLELKGQKPIFANYTISGVGDEGVVLLLPGPESHEGEKGIGRTVTVTLPENQLAELKSKLKEEWGIV